ncbi:MAG: protease modulator HflC, partial [Candidatus Omnitrophica bacterium]|nr:protease modulator HflC [Candidatus Omnitrophota bacterium]
MNRGLNIILVIAIFICIFAATGVFYTVDETQQVVLTQFGKLIGEPKTESGLYFKLPWQTPNYFDKRVLIWDGDANQIPTVEKRFIWVDTTARWRINDPLKFMQSVKTETSAQSRLDDIIDASTRDIISSNKLVEAVRNTNRLLEDQNAMDFQMGDEEFGKTALAPIDFGREELSRKILQRAAVKIDDFGIELVDVRIKRINYVREVQNEVYERMISERNRAAEKFRSEGQGKRAEIEGLMG